MKSMHMTRQPRQLSGIPGQLTDEESADSGLLRELQPDKTMIGSTIWVFDEHHRCYTKPARGSLWGELIWREHWVPRKVIAETSRSWVLDDGRKIPKRGANPRLVAFSAADIDRQEWVHGHRHRIAREVERCYDFDALRTIAAAVGYKA